jgi:hypothetical protein
MRLFSRWFAGAYGTTVIAGFAASPWYARMVPFPPIIGVYVIPFALPFVLGGALVGLGLQWATQAFLPPGTLRTVLLATLAAAAGALGTELVTHSLPFVLIAMASAVAGAILTQSEAAWRKAWFVVILSAAAATGLVIGATAAGLT